MSISARVIEHSTTETGDEIITFMLRYPRFIHAEFMTHRQFSRNASSSRAIPVSRLIADVESDPAMPLHFGRNQKGMQAHEELKPAEIESVKRIWLEAKDEAVAKAKFMAEIGAHKQIVNRVLEPFAHINVVMTTCFMDNFYTLRLHEDAQPEIKMLAEAMHNAQAASTPRVLKVGEFHKPFVSDEEMKELGNSGTGFPNFLKASVARCARTSYLTHDGKIPELEKDIHLFNRLIVSKPIHASPCEHQACVHEESRDMVRRLGMNGNLSTAWIQFRKIIEHTAEEATKEVA